MGIAYNLLNISGGAPNNSFSVDYNIHVQEDSPIASNGLWIKSNVTPSGIEIMSQKEIEPVFGNWETVVLPSGYSSFAVVDDHIYLIGNSNGTYAKASLLSKPLSFTYHNANTIIDFRNTVVIDNTIYATKEGSTLTVYQMNLTDSEPKFNLILPEVTSYNNPRLTSCGSKLYALRGATSGSSVAMVLDTSESNPSWTSLASLSEDTSMSSIIVCNNMLYAIGVMSSGSKCYALDISNSSATWQIVTGFSNQGTNYAALSIVGGFLRILNSGFATTARNSLSLIDGVWKTSSQTGLTLLNAQSASYTSAYHTDYGLYVKDVFNDNLYVLDRNYPELNKPDNTLLLVENDNADITNLAKIDNFHIKERISKCYLLNIVDGNQILTRLPIECLDS